MDSYPNLIQALEYIAEQLIKKEHTEINRYMTEEEKISFVNSVSTINQHSLHIQRNTLFHVS